MKCLYFSAASVAQWFCHPVSDGHRELSIQPCGCYGQVSGIYGDRDAPQAPGNHGDHGTHSQSEAD